MGQDELEPETAAVLDRGLAWIDEHEAALLDALERLVGRPSVTGAEGSRDDSDSVVGTLHALLGDWLEEGAVTTHRVDDGDRPRENVYATVEGTGGELLVCTSHTDTVAAGDAGEWPGGEPFSIARGTATRVEAGTVELSVAGDTVRRSIRDRYDRTWVRRNHSERDVLVGRGVYDNKASIVCLLGAMAALDHALGDATLGGTLLHGHLVGEEVAQDGAKAMVGWGDRTDWLGNRFPDRELAVVVLDGSYGFVPAVGHRGLAWITLRAEGEPTHAATPHLGRNAIAGMADVLATARDGERTAAITRPLVPDRLLGEPTVAAGTTIVGGDVFRDRTGAIDRAGVNTIPEWCEATFDVRFQRWEDYPAGLEDIRQHFADAIESVASASHPELEWTATADPAEFFPPVALADDREAARSHPLVAETRAATARITGHRPDITVAPGVTDAAAIAPATGAPTIVEYGPAGAWSHETYEFVERESVIEGAKILLALTLGHLGLAQDGDSP